MTSVVFAYHGTLTANAVSSVTVTSGASDQAIEVINRSGSAEIYFTVNGATPTVGGNDCYVVPASVTSYIVSNGGQTVQLISSGAPTFSVIGLGA